MLIATFTIFLLGLCGMLWMIARAFPRIATIAVVQHRRFSFLGIENVHILEYKSPKEVFKRRFFVSLEKFFRRLHTFLLKFDNTVSRGIEWTQQKRDLPPVGSEIVEESVLPPASHKSIGTPPTTDQVINLKKK